MRLAFTLRTVSSSRRERELHKTAIREKMRELLVRLVTDNRLCGPQGNPF